MDFSPRPPGFNAPIARASFDDTADKLKARAEDVCRHLLPGGKLSGPEWEVADLSGARGKSLKVNTKTGVWADFGTDDGGHDLIALWAAVKGIRMVEAKQEAERWLGVEQRKPVKAPAPVWTKAAPAAKPSRPTVPGMVETAAWDYCDADGVFFGSVLRFDDPAGKERKEFRPWDGKQTKAPEGQRPLYNLPAILRAPPGATIVVVEGEKAADSVTALGDPLLVATTAWGGAAATAKTDWSPLAGRHVLRWADNDAPRADGKPSGCDVWLKATHEHITKAGPASLRDLVVPEGKPDGWDAADAGPDERRALIQGPALEQPVPQRVRLADMTADKLFAKKPPPQEWLVNSVIPFGRGGVVAAAGDTGKGMLLVDLAIKVAEPRIAMNVNPPMAFGHTVERHGAVVILSAEDDTDELNRRVRALGPDMSPEAKRRLYVLPYPDMTGRTPTYMAGDANKVEATQEFADVYQELRGIPDLALVIIDPLAAFAGVDLSTPSASQMVGNAFDKLAKDLGCTAIAAHHLTKGDRRYPIETAADARHAIGGAGQLLNSMRFAYALWAPGEEKERAIMSKLNLTFTNNQVYKGAVVKSNAASDRDVATYVRNANGLLCVVDWRELADKEPELGDIPSWMSQIAIDAVRHFASTGHLPLKSWIAETPRKDSPTGQWFNLMPAAWREYSASEFNGISRGQIVDAAIAAGLILEMSGKPKYLYVPGDEWDRNVMRYPRDLKKGGAAPKPVKLTLMEVE